MTLDSIRNSCDVFLQVLTFCGPWDEKCVANQTLKDKSCLIPCTGLYADITDYSVKQSGEAFEKYVVEGKNLKEFVILIRIQTRFPHID